MSKHITAYMNFPGNCEEAFNFYKDVFGADDFEMMSRFSELPEGSGMPLEDSEKNNIMHMTLRVGDLVLMGSDTPKSSGEVVFGNSIHLHISVESKEEADRVFGRFSDDGNVVMPLEDTFWNSYFGVVVDRYGTHWMIDYTDQSQG